MLTSLCEISPFGFILEGFITNVKKKVKEKAKSLLTNRTNGDILSPVSRTYVLIQGDALGFPEWSVEQGWDAGPAAAILGKKKTDKRKPVCSLVGDCGFEPQ